MVGVGSYIVPVHVVWGTPASHMESSWYQSWDNVKAFNLQFMFVAKYRTLRDGQESMSTVVRLEGSLAELGHRCSGGRATLEGKDTMEPLAADFVVQGDPRRLKASKTRSI